MDLIDSVHKHLFLIQIQKPDLKMLTQLKESFWYRACRQKGKPKAVDETRLSLCLEVSLSVCVWKYLYSAIVFLPKKMHGWYMSVTWDKHPLTQRPHESSLEKEEDIFFQMLLRACKYDSRPSITHCTRLIWLFFHQKGGPFLKNCILELWKSPWYLACGHRYPYQMKKAIKLAEKVFPFIFLAK